MAGKRDPPDELKQQIQAFERELDAALEARPCRQWDATATLDMASEVYEVMAARMDHPGGPAGLDRGMTILASWLVSGAGGYIPAFKREADLLQLRDDLTFSGHYFMLREYLYYTYNAKGSIAWSFTEDRVEVRFADRSIPRQFFMVFNDMVMNSVSLFDAFESDSAEIRRLLEHEPEGAETPNTAAAWRLIERETDLKLSAYFNILPADSEIELGGYTYAQFVAIYRVLTTKALYHRYLARDRDAVGAIYLPCDGFVAAVQADLGFDEPVVHAVLKDVVYDTDAADDRLDGSYFSLFREGGGDRRIVMRPHHFATDEGLVNLLRVVGQRRPETFLRAVSNTLGSAFVRRAKAAWEAEGFLCHAEVSLRDIDASLPDIDLMVISEEPTLGYVIFLCELKSPIPPKWAKDQLRALNTDGVSKAFRQAEALKAFLGKPEGIDFIGGFLPKEGHPHFDRFVIAVDHLVITSDNGGMFFSGEQTKIIGFRTLERLLRRSDGDMALIQQVLATYAEIADETLVTGLFEFQLNGRTIAYEGVTNSPLLDFPQGDWRGSPARQPMIDEFLAAGLHPFDTFQASIDDVVLFDGEGRSDGRAPS